MESLAQTGISYSDEHLTGEFVQWLVDTTIRPQASIVLMSAPPPPSADLEAAVRAAWKELEEDPRFVAEAQRRNYNADQALADLRRRMEQPVTATLDQRIAAKLTLKYTVTREKRAFVHRVNGTPILMIPPAQAAVSANARATLYAIYVVVDVLSVVAAAAGVYITQGKEALSKSLATPLQRFLTWIGGNTAEAAELERLQKAGKKVDVIVKVLSWLRGTVNLKEVVTAFFDSLRWWEKAVTVVQFVASITVTIASFGASLTVKLVQLGAAIAVLFADVVLLVGALTKPAMS